MSGLPVANQVGWVNVSETQQARVGFRTSTQPTHLTSADCAFAIVAGKGNFLVAIA